MESIPLNELIESTLQMAAQKDGYLGRPAEREFLTKALEKGITVDIARAALLDAARNGAIVLESAVLRDARHNLAQMAANGSRVTEAEFLSIVQEATVRAKGHLSETSVKTILLDIIDDNEYPVKTFFLKSSWLEKIRKEIATR
jgi:hypothetical protein